MCSSFRKLLDIYRLNKYESEKVGSGNGAIFGGHRACFLPRIHPESVTKVSSITSRHSRAWKQNLIREFRCELCESARARERRGGKRVVGEFEKRRALTSLVFTFYGRQSKGGLVSSRDAFTIVFRRLFSCYQCSGEPIELTPTQHAQFTRACSLISTAAKVF